MDRMPEFVHQALLNMAHNIIMTKPDQILDDGESEYMHRWYLEKSRKTGSVYIHRILRSDRDEELHDHPGENMSLILAGTMTEILDEGSRILSPGDIVYRPADFRHRLVLERPVTTIWIMGERVREWGFWDKEGSFVKSKEFFKRRGRIALP